MVYLFETMQTRLLRKELIELIDYYLYHAMSSKRFCILSHSIKSVSIFLHQLNKTGMGSLNIVA